LLGNYLLIEGEPGVALYAHLRKGSVLAQQGQLVQAGERLGNVGNSGNSTMPHLHFHVTDRANLWEAEGVYCDFTAGEPGTVPIVPPLMKPFRARPLRTGDA
jgi:murein DD-endopeptidase MepM/ murein hydrolase activator NlpD